MNNHQEKQGLFVCPEISRWSGYLHLHIIERKWVDGKVKTFVAKEIVWEEVKEWEVTPASCPVQVHPMHTQEFFDSLCNQGLRNSDGKNNDAVINAKNEHIDDLRKIVFKNSKQQNAGF